MRARKTHASNAAPQEDGEVVHHHNHHLIEKTEGGMDYLMVAIIVALGLAMAIGLVTASGDASWLR
jgi:hypothetical protein